MQDSGIIKTNRLFCIFSLLVIAIAVVKIMVQLEYCIIPGVFLAVGLGLMWWRPSNALMAFMFLFPFITASPALNDNGYPFNYMAIPIFLLSGMVIASVIRKWSKKNTPAPHGENLDRGFTYYYLFLIILVLSTLFVFIRWSNFDIISNAAIGTDTPVAPDTPQSVQPLRISFGSIFPLVSLFLYFISPYIFFYIKKLKTKEDDVFKWLSLGFYISVGFAVVQRILNRSLISDRLGKELKQFYGGFSDFNAFGFFSGVMFLWSTYEIRKKNIFSFITFAVSLAGGILSGSRTFYFFILAGIINLVYQFIWQPLRSSAQSATVHRGKSQGRKPALYQKSVVITLIVVVIVAIVLAGGTLKKRLTEGFDKEGELYEKLNAVSNGRLWMSQFTVETIGEYFPQGIGTGNFTFYLAHKNYLPYKKEGEKYLYDLTLNHYLLIFVENGVFGFLFFTYFMIFLYRRSGKKLLIGTILFSLLFNNFFWFPEAFLLFWVVAALNHQEQKKEEKNGFFSKFSTLKKSILVGGCLVVFIIFNIVSFQSLHPLNWAKETGFRYDYGFWYPEKDHEGDSFQWTMERAGIYFVLDENGESSPLKLVCGAPLEKMKESDHKQTVVVYWQNKLYKTLTFTMDQKEILFKVKATPLTEGFLEFKVAPTFNESRLGLSEETRDLGIRVSQPQH